MNQILKGGSVFCKNKCDEVQWLPETKAKRSSLTKLFLSSAFLPQVLRNRGRSQNWFPLLH